MKLLAERFSMASQLAEASKNKEGVVLRIERSSIHDGAGLRTVVFLKGCPLRCQWCSTPESMKPQPERGYLQSRCSLCGTCVQACPAEALTLHGESLARDVGLCRNCFTCADVCPNEAVHVYGRKMSVEEVVAEISRDEVFFFHSGGGVTLSGGECLQQIDFVLAILTECRHRGINTAIETSFFASWPDIERVLPLLDILFIDLKHPDPSKHVEITGVDNTLLLENLRRLDESSFSGDVTLRIPLIPGINDSDSTLQEMLAIAATLDKLQEIEILPYHRLGVSTYERLEQNYLLRHVRLPAREYIEERVEFLGRQKMVDVPIRVGGGFNIKAQ
jgi:pyruvate formate lyase activating enzyme